MPCWRRCAFDRAGCPRAYGRGLDYAFDGGLNVACE